MNDDPLSYVRQINEIDWKSLGYSRQLTRELTNPNASQFLGGADMDAYFEEGGVSSSKLQNLSAARIISSVLEAKVDVGAAGANTYVRLDGPNNRIIINDGSNDRILMGFQSGGF